MNLYIDGDAFPNLLKPILFRAINRESLSTIVVSNKRINIGDSEYISYTIAASGPDEADNRIVEMVEEGDLVITSDIQLADRVITKKAFYLFHAYLNPFNPSTRIIFEVPFQNSREKYLLFVSDLLGRKLVSKEYNPDRNEQISFTWNAENYKSVVHLIVIRSSIGLKSEKIVLIKYNPII